MAHSSIFLQTLNLKSRDTPDQSDIAHTSNAEDGAQIVSDSHGFDQVTSNRPASFESANNMESFVYNIHNDSNANCANTSHREEPLQDVRYPNFLTDEPDPPVNDFKSESDSLNESENQNSLGKTLATSLHLIAATDAHTIPPHVEVETPFPDSVGIEVDEPPSNVEPPGPSSNDSVTSTTPETVSTPHPIRYRTRSIAGVERNSSFIKKEPLPRNDQCLESKEERISSTEEEAFYRCDQCGKVFHKKQTLRQHFITHTDRFACAFCNVRCKSKGDLKSHTQTHTKEKPFHCEVCNTFYTRESILKKHKTTQLHKTTCLKMEKTRSNLSKQEKKLPSDNSYSQAHEPKAPKKNKKSYSKYSKVSFTRKELRKHPKTQEFSLICSKCRKKCKSVGLLRIHERCHLKATLLICKICSRSFSTKAILKEHTKSHYRLSGRYSIVGGQCLLPMKEAFTFSALQRNPQVSQKNTVTNTGTKLRKQHKILYCPACPRQFKSPKAFEKHCAKHVAPPEQSTKEDKIVTDNDNGNVCNGSENKKEDSVHSCADCTTTFDTLENLNTHRVEVHNTQSMTCHICYRVFKESSEYKDHVQNHAPTMLFSGESLEDSRITTSSKKTTKRGSSRPGAADITDQEFTGAYNAEVSHKDKILIRDESDIDKSLNCHEFIKLLRTAVSESSDEGCTDDDCDEGESSDEQLYHGLQNLFCFDMADHIEDQKVEGRHSGSSCHHKDQTSLEFQSFLDSHTSQDSENSRYICVPCNASYENKDKFEDHVKSHACNACAKYFTDKKCSTDHDIQPKNKGRENPLVIYEFTHLDECSTSEDEDNDLFLDELESILDCEMKTTPQVDLLHTFSHDEIVKVNRKVFERYSCIDVPTNIYACTICKRKYARPTTLTRHFKTHVCVYCNKFFIDKSDLLEHKYKHRQKAAMLKAEISGEQSTKVLNSPLVSKVNRELIKKFTLIDSSRNINKCCLCDKTFVRKTVLTRHMKTHICTYCDKFYEDKYELARHIGMHKIDAHGSEDGGDAREYNDFDDEKPFSSRSTLTDQLETTGKVVTIDPAFSSSIPHFPSTFANPGEGDQDTLTFIEIPVSDNCGNTSNVNFGDNTEAVTSTYQIISDSIDAFKESAHESFLVDGSGCQPDDPSKIITIAQSQMIEEGGNRDRLNIFECNLCGKTFFKSVHLKSHMSTHTVRKPHVCQLCGKSFVRQGALKRHEKTHEIKRCKLCEASFNYQFELDEHLQMHESYSFYK